MRRRLGSGRRPCLYDCIAAGPVAVASTVSSDCHAGRQLTLY